MSYLICIKSWLLSCKELSEILIGYWVYYDRSSRLRSLYVNSSLCLKLDSYKVKVNISSLWSMVVLLLTYYNTYNIKPVFKCYSSIIDILFFDHTFVACWLDTVQDFLIKLDIKPLMHLLEISIFSLNNDLIRLTKIMNNLVKDLSFKVIFECLKLVESFQKNFMWRIFD